MPFRNIVPILALVVVSTTGCATHYDRLCEVRNSYYMGDTQRACEKIDKYLPKHPKEADAFQLERATVLLSDGRAKEAEQVFRKVRDHFDRLEQTNVADQALSMLTDDRQLAYSGEDYERVLLRVFLALSNLLDDGQDAEAYSLQVAAKQQEIVEKGKEKDGKNPKESYKQVAVGAYLRAALREETHLHYDDAARSLELVCQWTPEYATAARDLERVKSGRHSSPGHGVVYVFTLVGEGPHKEEEWAIASQAALLVADRIVSATAKHSLPPTIAPIKVPKVVVPTNNVQSVRVGVSGRPAGQTETITDVGRMAREQSEALWPYLVGRAVARRVLKKAAVYGAKEAVGVKEPLVELAFDAGGVVWEALECADTRCWGLLPEKIQVLRLELPVGTHDLTLEPVNAGSYPIGPPHGTRVQVVDGRNTYVLASFPSDRLAGKVSCSREP